MYKVSGLQFGVKSPGETQNEQDLHLKGSSFRTVFRDGPAPSWGFRPLRFPPNQISKQQHLRAVKQN